MANQEAKITQINPNRGMESQLPFPGFDRSMIPLELPTPNPVITSIAIGFLDKRHAEYLEGNKRPLLKLRPQALQNESTQVRLSALLEASRKLGFPVDMSYIGLTLDNEAGRMVHNDFYLVSFVEPAKN